MTRASFLVLALVLASSGCLGGGSDSSSAPANSTTTSPGTTAPASDPPGPPPAGDAPPPPPEGVEVEEILRIRLAYDAVHDLADAPPSVNFTVRLNTTFLDVTLHLNATNSGAYALLPPGLDGPATQLGPPAAGAGDASGQAIRIEYDHNVGKADQADQILAGPLAVRVDEPVSGTWKAFIQGWGVNEYAEVIVVAHYA